MSWTPYLVVFGLAIVLIVMVAIIYRITEAHVIIRQCFDAAKEPLQKNSAVISSPKGTESSHLFEMTPEMKEVLSRQLNLDGQAKLVLILFVTR
jgi:Na+-transporting methylmalonyl-CoA/oxaloacetate decarboxylase gamma subunit